MQNSIINRDNKYIKNASIGSNLMQETSPRNRNVYTPFKPYPPTADFSGRSPSRSRSPRVGTQETKRSSCVSDVHGQKYKYENAA